MGRRHRGGGGAGPAVEERALAPATGDRGRPRRDRQEGPGEGSRPPVRIGRRALGRRREVSRASAGDCPEASHGFAVIEVPAPMAHGPCRDRGGCTARSSAGSLGESGAPIAAGPARTRELVCKRSHLTRCRSCGVRGARDGEWAFDQGPGRARDRSTAPAARDRAPARRRSGVAAGSECVSPGSALKSWVPPTIGARVQAKSKPPHSPTAAVTRDRRREIDHPARQLAELVRRQWKAICHASLRGLSPS
jgi:hypothetical protein